MAVAKRPELLVLDEPAAALDPLARREFLDAVAAAVAEGAMSVVLSSHLVSDLERVCDYLIILTAARVQAAGTVAELLAAYRAEAPAPKATVEDMVLAYLDRGREVERADRSTAGGGR
jgi:ABC-2 type transport system ATP-binding protein